jgi:hypothetical protein
VGSRWCTATRNSWKGSGGRTCVRAARDGDFKNCCLRTGKYDDSNRDYFFQGVVLAACGAMKKRKKVLDFRFSFAIVGGGRGNGKRPVAPLPFGLSRVAGRLKCRASDHPIKVFPTGRL